MTSGPQFSSVLLLSRVPLFATSWTAARQASLSITSSQNLLKLVTIESVMPWLDDLRPSEELNEVLHIRLLLSQRTRREWHSVCCGRLSRGPQLQVVFLSVGGEGGRKRLSSSNSILHGCF